MRAHRQESEFRERRRFRRVEKGEVHGIEEHLNRARRRREKAVKAVFLGAALTTVVISFFIIETVIVEAIGFLQQIELSQLFGIGWVPRRGIFDIGTLIIGTQTHLFAIAEGAKPFVEEPKK